MSDIIIFFKEVTEQNEDLTEPPAPTATLVSTLEMPPTPTHRDIAGMHLYLQIIFLSHLDGQTFRIHTDYYFSFSVDASDLGVDVDDDDSVKVKFETLRAIDQSDAMDMDQHMQDRVSWLF